MEGGLAFEDENAYKGGEGVQKGQFFADVLIECPLRVSRSLINCLSCCTAKSWEMF